MLSRELRVSIAQHSHLVAESRRLVAQLSGVRMESFEAHVVRLNRKAPQNGNPGALAHALAAMGTERPNALAQIATPIGRNFSEFGAKSKEDKCPELSLRG